MKILLIHTYYQLKGGEDAVFEQESLLLSKEHQVMQLPFHNKSGIKGAIQFFSSIWNISSGAGLRKKIKDFHPEIIHIHNWHFGAGPLIIRVAKKMGVPVVLTLHNYRLLCPSASLMDNGKLFTDSIHAKFPWTAIKKKVYRNSFLQTFWLAFIIWFHKKIGTWEMVDKYIVLTDFARNLFIQSSFKIPSTKFIVNPNFVIQPVINIGITRKNHFLFVGRLTKEKGVQVLFDAFKSTDFELKVAGDGPLKDSFLSNNDNKNIHYLGNLSSDAVKKEMQECTALIFPSIWYEGMPMTILEAFALGTPVIASNFGAMASIIEHEKNGIFFEVDNSNDLRDKLYTWQSFGEHKKLQYYIEAKTTYLAKYAPENHSSILSNVYKQLIKNA